MIRSPASASMTRLRVQSSKKAAGVTATRIGSRKRLPLSREPGHDSADIVDEPHVEHSVCFVEHQHFPGRHVAARRDRDRSDRQHQFEQTFWARGRECNFHEAALRGSSHYDLPGILRWFTANIGVHHVHHLCSRIPYYRLPQTLRDNPNLHSVGRLTLLQSFRCVRLVLWDEGRSPRQRT